MSGAQDYYNSFYLELSRIDAEHNGIEKVQRYLPRLAPGMRVLDIGCGHGSVTRSLVAEGVEVTGVEINADAIATLRQLGFRVIEADLSKSLPMSETYDLVLLLDVLEHVFDPLFLLGEARKALSPSGVLILTVPLYFDLVDRLRILFTGSVISYDNRCYGRDLYAKFRSFNYDHIRFFRPNEVLEMCRLLSLKVESVHYAPMAGFGPVSNFLVRLIANKLTVVLWPSLLAHSMVVKVRL